jgi:hypothetical protein
MRYTKQAELDRIKQATCQIIYGGESGTGYLISGSRIVTCWHVVENIPRKHADRSVPEPSAVERVRHQVVDKALDVAALNGEPVPVLSRCSSDAPRIGRPCGLGFGFPALAKNQGLPIEGTLHDLSIKDGDAAESLLVKAERASRCGCAAARSTRARRSCSTASSWVT